MNGSESAKSRASKSASSSKPLSSSSTRSRSQQTSTNQSQLQQPPSSNLQRGHSSQSAPVHAGHGQSGHSHVHDEESIRRIVNRLSRIEGHIRGIKRMVQEQENCPDVLIQVAAVRGALDKVSRVILDEHLTQCVVRAAQEGNIEGELAELQAALNRFLPS